MNKIIENILNESILYRRVHKNKINFNTEKPTPNFFDFMKNNQTKELEKELSVNRNKYCKTPLDSRNKAKSPNNNWVVSLLALNIRSFCDSNVIHTPSNDDKSHSSVKPNMWIESIITNNMLYTRYKNQLAFYSKWEIKPK